MINCVMFDVSGVMQTILKFTALLFSCETRTLYNTLKHWNLDEDNMMILNTMGGRGSNLSDSAMITLRSTHSTPFSTIKSKITDFLEERILSGGTSILIRSNQEIF